jgi:hypothetical protein
MSTATGARSHFPRPTTAGRPVDSIDDRATTSSAIGENPGRRDAQGLIRSEISARAAWATTLDASERRCLPGLIRKMLTMRGGR